jgi:type VII secretion integral membrane protein EccD
VTVVNGSRRVDLALPSALPIADVVPQLLRFCTPDERPDAPAAWTLSRLGGTNLGLGHSLADAGVLDGEILELRSVEAATRPAYVEDVRDAVEDAVDSSGGQWRSRTTVSFVLAVAAIAVGMTALLPFTREPHATAGITTAAIVAALCVTGGWWGTGRAHPAAIQLAVAAGWVWGGVGGWLAGTSSGWPRLAAFAAGAAGALLVAAAARVVTPLATAHLAGFVVLAAAAGLAAGGGGDITVPRRVAAVLAVLVIGALPRAAVSVGGLATADYRVRKSQLLTQQEIAARVRQSNALLFGGLVGIAVVGILAGVGLAYSHDGWDRLLGLAVGVGFLLRSRVFSRVLHMSPLRVAGVVVLAAQGVRIGSLPEVRPWLPVLVAVAGGLLVALGAAPLSDITRARVKRALNWTESVVVVVTIALAAAGLGLYDQISTMGR